ncbi:tetratricopeptide repeat-containing sulfotransferase family protein [Planctomicrobium sp. SH661]|uniref:tetratricopeptide repeat-containing sulfotransferase family protein n=1 Tax=Planctomicrobium sp. SH661 TaxID=3448124 RepID=UPI003F5AF88F
MPQKVETQLAEGRSLHMQGLLKEALAHYQQVLDMEPGYAPAWHLAGVAKLQLRDVPAAVDSLKRAVQLDAGVAGYHRNLGEAFQAAADFSAAVLSFEQALRLDPVNCGTWTSLSDALLQMGETTPALDCLRQALQLNPDYLAARILLGNVHKDLKELDSAAGNYRFVLQHDPENLVATVNLASVLREQGETHQAIELLRSVVDRGAANPTIAYNLANTLVDVGEFAEARARYASALPLHPQPAKVLFNLSSIRKFKEEDREQLAQWESIARSRLSTNDDAVHLHFALGKAHDDLGDYTTAFEHYRQGNQLVPVTFDAELHRQQIREVIGCWSHEFLQSRSSWGEETSAPVFIVGMPRSGTTLVEQILSSHPHVQGLGEREEMGQAVQKYEASLGCENQSALAAGRLTQADIHGITADYLAGISLAEGKRRFTDKMPANFLLLGWIATCFPHATLIHCVRDPRDTCLSCYFQHFTARLPYAYDLSHLVAYYRAYEELMKHWHSVLPGRILDVKYEDLVATPEAQSRRLIEHCGLEWDDACLQSHAADRSIRTASSWQVRQPIHTGSRRRWVNYREHIGELLQAFGEMT